MGTTVLVVDDTVVFRRVISGALSAIPGVEVVGTASDGRAALARIATMKPDLVTLDIEMPEMNGIEVLQALSSAAHKPYVVVLSSHTVRGGELTLKALEAGAVDFLTKPTAGTPEEYQAALRSRLLPIVRALEARRGIRAILGGHSPAPTTVTKTIPASRPAAQRPRVHMSGRLPIVLIGVSTGGPAALAKLVPALPGDLGAPLLIVQHMPSLFTRSLAASLNAKSAISVKEAEDGELAQVNTAYIAPGGRHMKLAGETQERLLIRITDDPPEHNCRPSVDYLFRSVALNFPGRTVAAILTGMGSDGATGLRLLKKSRCISIAQDEASCTVFGMPREAIQTGAVDIVAPLEGMPETITRAVREMSA